VNAGAAGALALAAVLTLGACGTTYVDETAPSGGASADTTTATTVPVDQAESLDGLMGEIETLMFDLDQRIIDGDGDVATLARINALWAVAEPQIRSNDPDDLFNFEQAIELARSGVERRRPADPSKGYKILVDVNDAYFATG
jgi:hypothetical protein